MAKKSNKIIIAIIIGAVILCGIIAVIFMQRKSDAEVTSLTVGKETYSESEINFYYTNAYKTVLQSAQGYEQFIGLDTTKDLKEQECSMSDSGQSWYEYIMEQAQNQLIQTSAEYQDALKNGYKDEDADNLIKNYVEYYELQAQEAGKSDLDTYLAETYGEDFTQDILKRILKEQSIAEKYEQDTQNNMTFTEDEIENYYQEHISEFTEYSYLYAYIKDQSVDTEKLMKAKSQDEFKKLTKELTGSDAYEMTNIKGSEIGDETAEDTKWISDPSRKEGDCYKGEAGEAGYVLYYISCSDMGKSKGDEQWKIDVKAGLKDQRLKEWQEKIRSGIE